MSINKHDLGDLVAVTGSFSDPGTGDAIDPDVVKVTITQPNGTETDYVYGTDAGVIKDAAGEYHMDIDANAIGTWYYRWWSTGTGQAAEKRPFVVTNVRMH